MNPAEQTAVAAFLATHRPTVCPPRFAAGAHSQETVASLMRRKAEKEKARREMEFWA